MTRKKSAILIVLSIVTALSLISAVSIAFADTSSQFSDIVIAENYCKNDTMKIPTVSFSTGGRSYPTTAVLHCPDGSASEVKGNALLTQFGLYTLEYKASVDGTYYSTERDFYVYQPKFELSSSDDRVEYIENYDYALGNSGEFVSLSQDQSLTINDYFDISKATLSKPIFKAIVIPSSQGSADFATLQVDFINKEDPNRYLRVIGNYSSYNHCTYFLAGADNQTPTGLEKSGNRLHVGDNWGAAIYGPFDDVSIGGRNRVDSAFTIYLDYETKTVQAQYGTFVIDLDDSQYFGELWQGFESGDVYVKISASRYVANKPAQIFILSVGDIDLSEQNVFDRQGPEITVDFGEEDENDLPCGIVGNKYRVFGATATDYLSGECRVKATVYGRYGQSSQFVSQIVNGYFTPSREGEYLLRYSATDKSGNESVKDYRITVYGSYSALSLTLGDKTTFATNGQLVPLAKATVSNNIGSYKVEYSVTLGGEEMEVFGGSFRPYKTGNHTVTVTVKDHSERVATQTYTISVAGNGKPVFVDEIYLPHYLINGSTYAFDEVYAYDYSTSGQIKKVKATLVTEDKNGTVEHADDRYTPSVSSHLDIAKVYYKATLSGGTTTSEVFEIPVCIVRSGSALDISRYFIGNGVSVSKTNEGMILTTSTDGATVEFANVLLAQGADIKFEVNANKNDFNKVNVYLRDVKNYDEVLKITYEKASTKTSYFYVNGGTKFEIPASFDGLGDNPFAFKYSNDQLTITDTANVTFPVSKKLNGEAFTGFSSGKVYLTIEFEGVAGEASLTLVSLNNQNTTNATADTIKPRIALTRLIDRRYSINDEVQLATAIALDVLDPSIQSYYTVTDTTGKVMKDVNGATLERVALDKTPTIKLTAYGVYRVQFYAVDWNNRKETTFGYVLEVVDVSAPVVVVGEMPSTAAYGSDIVLPSVTSIDELEGSTAVTVFVLCPDGAFRKYGSGKVTETNKYTQKGKYTFYFYTFDESGNTTVKTKEVTVK